MIDSYYRNGELFLAELAKRKEGTIAQGKPEEFLKDVKITDK